MSSQQDHANGAVGVDGEPGQVRSMVEKGQKVELANLEDSCAFDLLYVGRK